MDRAVPARFFRGVIAMGTSRSTTKQLYQRPVGRRLFAWAGGTGVPPVMIGKHGRDDRAPSFCRGPKAKGRWYYSQPHPPRRGFRDLGPSRQASVRASPRLSFSLLVFSAPAVLSSGSPPTASPDLSHRSPQVPRYLHPRCQLQASRDIYPTRHGRRGCSCWRFFR